MANAIKASTLPLFNTGPVNVAVSLGISKPTRDTEQEAATIMIMSLNVTLRFIKRIKSGIDSFFCGNGL